MCESEYVDYIKSVMEVQNNTFMWFMGILGLMAVVFGILQWRLTTKQIEQITNNAKEEAKSDLMDELNNTYKVYLVNGHQDDITKLKKDVLSLKSDISSIDLASHYMIKVEFIELKYLIASSSTPYGDIERLLNKYYSHLLRSKELVSELSDALKDITLPAPKTEIEIMSAEIVYSTFKKMQLNYQNTDFFKNLITQLEAYSISDEEN